MIIGVLGIFRKTDTEIGPKQCITTDNGIAEQQQILLIIRMYLHYQYGLKQAPIQAE